MSFTTNEKDGNVNARAQGDTQIWVLRNQLAGMIASACVYKTVLLVHKCFICKVKDRCRRVKNEKIHCYLVWHLAMRFDLNASN